MIEKEINGPEYQALTNYYFMDITPEEYNELIRMAENAGHVMD